MAASSSGITMAEKAKLTHELIVRHIRKGRKVLILTFALLIAAFLENLYLNCIRQYSCPGCELGWIYVCLAAVVVGVAFYYRK